MKPSALADETVCIFVSNRLPFWQDLGGEKRVIFCSYYWGITIILLPLGVSKYEKHESNHSTNRYLLGESGGKPGAFGRDVGCLRIVKPCNG